MKQFLLYIVACLCAAITLSSCDNEPSGPWKLINTTAPNGTGGSKYVSPEDEEENQNKPPEDPYPLIDKPTDLCVIEREQADYYTIIRATGPVEFRARIYDGIDRPYEFSDKIKLFVYRYTAGEEPPAGYPLILTVNNKGYGTWVRWTDRADIAYTGAEFKLAVHITPEAQARDYETLIEVKPSEMK